MTKQEAVELLTRIKNYKRLTLYEWLEIEKEALNMAIEALEQEPIIHCKDAVKVVRCRECEYWICNPNTTNYGVCGKVSYDDFEVIMEGDDFCSFGIHIK